MTTAKETMETEEQKNEAQATVHAEQEETKEAALNTGNAARMAAAVEKAALAEKNNIANDVKKEAAKKVVLQQVKKEAEKEAEIESAQFADMSPEDILKADQAERQQQYLNAMTPGIFFLLFFCLLVFFVV